MINPETAIAAKHFVRRFCFIEAGSKTAPRSYYRLRSMETVHAPKTPRPARLAIVVCEPLLALLGWLLLFLAGCDLREGQLLGFRVELIVKVLEEAAA